MQRRSCTLAGPRKLMKFDQTDAARQTQLAAKAAEIRRLLGNGQAEAEAGTGGVTGLFPVSRRVGSTAVRDGFSNMTDHQKNIDLDRRFAELEKRVAELEKGNFCNLSWPSGAVTFGETCSSLTDSIANVPTGLSGVVGQEERAGD